MRLEPRLEGEALAAYYPQDYWQAIAPGGRAPGAVELLQQKFIERRMEAGLKPLFQRLPSGARVLDVGCGSGALLRVLRRRGYRACGVEMSASAAAQAAGTGAQVHVGSLEDASYDASSFDAVTLFHVLEHLPDPSATLAEAHRVLRPGGYLLLEVPNIGALAYRLFGHRWHPLSVPLHLHHFSSGTLTEITRRAGFELAGLSYYSVRASAAGWALSIAPSLDPVALRCRHSAGRRVLGRKLAYLALQAAATPMAWLSAWIERGDVVVMVARKSA